MDSAAFWSMAWGLPFGMSVSDVVRALATVGMRLARLRNRLVVSFENIGRHTAA